MTASDRAHVTKSLQAGGHPHMRNYRVAATLDSGGADDATMRALSTGMP